MKKNSRPSLLILILVSLFLISTAALAQAATFTITIDGPVEALDIHTFYFAFTVADGFTFGPVINGDAIPSGGLLGWGYAPFPEYNPPKFDFGGTDQDFNFFSDPSFRMVPGEIVSFTYEGLIDTTSLLSEFKTEVNSPNLYPGSISLTSFDANGANFSAVPIPPTVLLLGAGIGGLVGIRRRVRS